MAMNDTQFPSSLLLEGMVLARLVLSHECIILRSKVESVLGKIDDWFEQAPATEAFSVLADFMLVDRREPSSLCRGFETAADIAGVASFPDAELQVLEAIAISVLADAADTPRYEDAVSKFQCISIIVREAMRLCLRFELLPPRRLATIMNDFDRGQEVYQDLYEEARSQRH